MFINWKSRELNLKIVYYGPALSGKTTNLEYIHAHVNREKRSDLVSVKTQEDRTLFFDFLQLDLEKISGLTPKIHLYPVPGQSYYEASRKLVLRGADGVVFVVDSAEDRLPDNERAWEDMKTHLHANDIALAGFPIIVQFNKQDLPNAMSGVSIRNSLSIGEAPSFEAVAIEGRGVFDTLKLAINSVVSRVYVEMA